MKKFSILLSLVALAIVFAGCEGPEGPAGADGDAGVDGIDGIAGVDANETCTVCHNEEDLLLPVKLQWAASTHATGGNYRRNADDCAPCHTSQGFLEVLASGADTTVADIVAPAPQNCRTCHEIHETYAVDDWGFRGATAFTGRAGVEINISDAANLCARCHQVRPSFPVPAVTVGTASVDSVTVSRYSSAHYATQGNMLTGTGAWEVVPTGAVAYGNSVHTTLVTNGCPTCHMADARAFDAGGHTMKIFYGDDPLALSFYDEGCDVCHGDDVDDLETVTIAAAAAEVDVQYNLLKDALIARGILDAAGSTVSQKISGEEWGAFYNYKMVYGDHGAHVHNSAYALAILKNTIAAIPEMTASGH